MYTLPKDIKNILLDFLDIPSTFVLCKTNKEFSDLGKSQQLWRRKIIKEWKNSSFDYNILFPKPEMDIFNWKTMALGYPYDITNQNILNRNQKVCYRGPVIGLNLQGDIATLDFECDLVSESNENHLGVYYEHNYDYKIMTRFYGIYNLCHHFRKRFIKGIIYSEGINIYY